MGASLQENLESALKGVARLKEVTGLTPVGTAFGTQSYTFMPISNQASEW